MKKKFLKKILCLALAIILILPFSSCARKERAFMELDGITLSEGVYKLMLSIQKGNMAYLINQYYGSHDSDEFWDTVVEAPSTTNDKYYTAAIFKKAENLISAAALFDEMKLELSKEKINAIDKEMSDFVDEFGGGKKEAFEGVLEGYGFTYNDLREYKILNAKAEAAANELYGEKGDKIGAGIKQEYLENNYYAFRQIFLANYYNKYKTDENGDVIYYDGNGNVAYDTVNGTPEPNDDGKLVYYTAEGKIAYDTKSGKPSPILDENGYQETADYTYEEMLERIELAAELMELGAESDKTFEALASVHSDDGVSATLTIYVASNVKYETLGASESYVFLDSATSKLAEMKVGEITLLQDESGLHIIRKYAIEEGAYTKPDYAGWFKDSAFGVYDFNSNLKNDLFTAVLAEYHDKIAVDEEILGASTLRDAVPNYYYH